MERWFHCLCQVPFMNRSDIYYFVSFLNYVVLKSMHKLKSHLLVFIKIREECTDLMKNDNTVFKIHWKEREQRTTNQYKIIIIQILPKHISYLHEPLVNLLVPYSDSPDDGAKLCVLFESWPYFIVLILQVVETSILSWNSLLSFIYFGLFSIKYNVKMYNTIIIYKHFLK